jgi:hypothetical protein
MSATTEYAAIIVAGAQMPMAHLVAKRRLNSCAAPPIAVANRLMSVATARMFLREYRSIKSPRGIEQMSSGTAKAGPCSSAMRSSLSANEAFTDS